MNNPLVSIIVPCYNQAQYLDEALQSVLDQTYANWECIIVNDGSPDDTEKVAKKWLDKDSRFKYIYKDNGGLSSARNAGLDMASGDYIQFLDSDDLIEKKKLEFQIQYMLNNTVVDISVSGYRYFINDPKKQQILGRNNFKHEVILKRDDIDIKEVFELGNPMVISASLYKRKVFTNVGFFDIQLKALEDWDFNFRCALSNLVFEHIGYENDTKTLIRLHDSSMMSDIHKINNQVVIFKNHIRENILYINYFGNKTGNIDEIKIVKKSTLKSKIMLFIPPVFFKFYNYVRKN